MTNAVKRILTKVVILSIAIFFFVMSVKFADLEILIQVLTCILSGIVSLFLLVDVLLEIREYKDNSKKRNPIFLRIVLLMFFIGIIFFSTNKVIEDVIFKLNNEKTTATVTEVRWHNISSNRHRRECYTLIKYEVKDIEYENSLGHNNCIYRENNTLTIYYEESNPNSIRTVPTIIYILISLVCYASFTFWLMTIKRLDKIKE